MSVSTNGHEQVRLRDLQQGGDVRQERQRVELLPDLLQDVLLAARPVVVGRLVACA